MRLTRTVLLAGLLAVPVVTPASAATQVETAPAPALEVGLAGVRQVANGFSHSCAVLTNGQVRCWGLNNEGQLGVGNFDPEFTTAQVVRNAADTGPLRNVVQVALGEAHTCALLENRQVRCFGDGFQGELGNGENDDRNLPVAVRNATDTANLTNVLRVGGEGDGACALLTNRQVRCWGDDAFGQLGNGAPNGDRNLPGPVLDVAGTANLSGVAALGMGFGTNCVVLVNGQARCWGYNGQGGLGDGGTGTSTLPVVVRNATDTAPLTGVTQISHGGYYGCARLSNGQARCWGANNTGGLGDGTQDDRHLPVPVEKAGGGVLTGVLQVLAGDGHTCARVQGGQVRCWGSDGAGQVGDGLIAQPAERLFPRAVRDGANSGNLANVDQLSSREEHNCAVRADDRVICWGNGDDGRLGDGDDDNEPLPVVVQV